MQKYDLKISSGWDPNKAKNDILTSEISYYEILYRPFDKRWSLTTSKANGFIGRQRMNVTPSMLEDNLGLVTLRINGENNEFVALITDTMVEKGSLPRGNYSIFPLYIYHGDGTRTLNLDSAKLSELTRNITTEATPEDVLDYIYAVLHSSKYRQRYKDFLKSDFPRIGIPTEAEYLRLMPLGRKLRELHLMKNPFGENLSTTFPQMGDCVVDKVMHDGSNVWINENQYFGNVSVEAWNFYIGGYQPAQKWLKDRKNKKLTDEELDQYQRIINILNETDRIMKTIDRTA